MQFPFPSLNTVWAMSNIRAERLASVQHNVRVSEQQHCKVPGEQLGRMGTRSLSGVNHRDQLRTLFNYTGNVSEISIGRLIIANCGHNGSICKANMLLVGLTASSGTT
jgi:hypothetical protein